MEALVLLIIFGSIFGSIVANRVFKYRHIERMKELETGQRQAEQRELLALREAKSDLEERLRHLETIVCNVDYELNAKLNRLSTRHLALEAALPGGSEKTMQAASEGIAAETERVLQGTVRPGQVVAGRFEIIRLLGAGGMGAVYLARDRKLSEEVALKVVAGLGLSDPGAAERLHREASAARRISHPNVVRLHDIGEEGGLLFLSMEFVDGESLHQRLTRLGRPMTPAELRPLLAMLCDGLAAAHAAGVVHRDLKPANILIDRGGQVKLIDFGIARMAHVDGMTATGMVIGTAEYMAPEQIRGGGIDARTDIYALGVIAFQALTGQPPFVGETPIAVSLAHCTEPVPAPRTITPQLPAAWESLILRALEKSPPMRFQTVADLRGALPVDAADPTIATPAQPEATERLRS
ncbi:MAG: serine/threonine protein kinase [Myxococcales bacterium]|nr:serine/threonine protein kinase [Myxococcales bacterium]